MEDNLIFFLIKDDLNFVRLFGMQHCFNPTRWHMEDDLNFLKMEDVLIFFENGRQPQFILMIEDNLNILTMEDDLNSLKI